MKFIQEIAGFMHNEQVDYLFQLAELTVHSVDGLNFTLLQEDGMNQAMLSTEAHLMIVPVPLVTFTQEHTVVPVFLIPASRTSVLYLYEDRWRSNPLYWQARLRVRWGRGERIFARNCRVVRPQADQLSSFLQACHTYGSTRSRYRYALVDAKDRLVAAATFSASRWMDREGIQVASWEWIRYASLPELTIVGGMSRLLETFVREVHPQEIMTYADLEWSSGTAYQQLGFEKVETRPCVEFCVDPSDWSRHSVVKMNNDRRYRNSGLIWQDWPRIFNLGSEKFLRRYW